MTEPCMAHRRYELTDHEWSILQPRLPNKLDTRINPPFERGRRIPAPAATHGIDLPGFMRSGVDIRPSGRTYPLAWPRSWKIRRSML